MSIILRQERNDQRSLAGSGLPDQQHETAWLLQESPFDRRKRFSMRLAHEEQLGRRCELEGRSRKPKVAVIHRFSVKVHATIDRFRRSNPTTSSPPCHRDAVARLHLAPSLDGHALLLISHYSREHAID